MRSYGSRNLGLTTFMTLLFSLTAWILYTITLADDTSVVRRSSLWWSVLGLVSYVLIFLVCVYILLSDDPPPDEDGEVEGKRAVSALLLLLAICGIVTTSFYCDRIYNHFHVWSNYDQAVITFGFLASIAALIQTCMITAGSYQFEPPIRTTYIMPAAQPIPTVASCPHCATANAYIGRARAVICYHCRGIFVVDKYGIGRASATPPAPW